MPKLIRPPETADITTFMRMLFLRTEQELIHEITRKRKAGYVDYAEVASLERVQKTLRSMVDESWSYVPTMIETIFYHSEKAAAGYRNARTLTAARTAMVQQLSNNLLGELAEASETAYKEVQKLYTIGRLEADPFREAALKQVLAQEAAGSGWVKGSAAMVQEMQNKGITAFVDKAGRRWSLQAYGNMAVRTTARQAEVAALLTADDYDLWQIVKIGSTCPVCAPLEGRVYSKSGTNPDYPPLTLAFGKVDPFGPEDLTNTYLNIHPNCLHSLVKYTTIGKSDKQIQRDKEFSNPVTNPITRDPRTKKQIAAYREKERARQKLLRNKKRQSAKNGQNQTGGKFDVGTYEWEMYRTEMAENYYEKIRKTNDIKAIAKVSGMSEDEIRRIKQHVFFKKHVMYDKTVRRFDADYDMAVAWKRLTKGVPESRDLLLLKHELLESKLEEEYNLTAGEAHEKAIETFDWYAEVIRTVGDLGEDDGLL